VSWVRRKRRAAVEETGQVRGTACFAWHRISPGIRLAAGNQQSDLARTQSRIAHERGPKD
jgi:hypothetical protein